jgi:hypothetical protein
MTEKEGKAIYYDGCGHWHTFFLPKENKNPAPPKLKWK